MEEETKLLYDKLYQFVKDAIRVLKKRVSVDDIPILTGDNIEKKDNNIFLYGGTEWRQIQGLKDLANLQSLSEAIEACNKHQQIQSFDGKWSYVFDYGSSFSASKVPINFLRELISHENGFVLRRKLFDEVFQYLIQYISKEDKSYARLVVPLDNLQITSRVIELEQDLRIRKLTSKEHAELRKNSPTLSLFYGTFLSPWFQSILEFDMPFNWFWVERNEGNALPYLQETSSKKQYQTMKARIDQEIVILRALLNRPVSSPTYVIDYRGWAHLMFTGGSINRLPWLRPSIPTPEIVTKKEIVRYQRYRQKLLCMTGQEAQRIFVAMRKLAFSMDKPYSGDQIMDTVSGLEGLLVGERDEVRHKFAERVAFLLGKGFKQRLSLQKDMRDAYDLRSEVAHGVAVTDNIDSIILQPSIGLRLNQKQVKELTRIVKLRLLTRNLLHRAILTCVDKQTTNFNWDAALLGARI